MQVNNNQSPSFGMSTIAGRSVRKCANSANAILRGAGKAAQDAIGQNSLALVKLGDNVNIKFVMKKVYTGWHYIKFSGEKALAVEISEFKKGLFHRPFKREYDVNTNNLYNDVVAAKAKFFDNKAVIESNKLENKLY